MREEYDTRNRGGKGTTSYVGGRGEGDAVHLGSLRSLKAVTL